MRKIAVLFLLLLVSVTSCSAQKEELLASIETTKGTIVLQLFFEEVPLTVSNFVGLANGIFAEENESLSKKGKYYDGIVFHRVVPGFVIQGGDPTGTGSGGPGYSFTDEFHPKLKHDKKGMLSMANSGPGTNGSQFFITLDATPHLDGKHSVFGQVKEGMDVVESIEQGDAMQSVTVKATKGTARQFLKNISWENFNAMRKENEEERKKEEEAQLAKIVSEIEAETPELQKTEDGIYVQEITPGTGKKVQEGDTVQTHYELRLYGEDKIIDSSYARKQPFEFKPGAKQVIAGWDAVVQTMSEGQKIRAVIPPELGYGSRGAGGVIPGNAFLDFTIELVSTKP